MPSEKDHHFLLKMCFIKDRRKYYKKHILPFKLPFFYCIRTLLVTENCTQLNFICSFILQSITEQYANELVSLDFGM